VSYLAPQLHFTGISDSSLGNGATNRRECVHALSDSPRKALLLCLLLKLAGGHVEAEEVTAHMGHRISNLDIPATFTNDNAEFNL